MKRTTICSYLLLASFSVIRIEAQPILVEREAVEFSNVEILDDFWKPRLKTVSEVTIPVCIQQTEVSTSRIQNFERAARNRGEKYEGMYYDDSDVYKALEAIAYSLNNHPDAKLEEKADEWIHKIAEAQLADGYLNTYYTLNGLDNRWSDMGKHEAYCAGHLMEAAVAYYNVTGKRELLEVAIDFADHIDSTFRLQNRHWIPGHQEIELALVKLSKATADKKYAEMADWFLQQRGHGYGQGETWSRWNNPSGKYSQDNLPVKEQQEITGHAVRAMYMYTGAADVGKVQGDTGYSRAMMQVWEDVVFRNMYITGGIGTSSGHNEGFSVDYDLVNEEAYCETCASVGMVFWNQRMNMLTGDGKYIDVLERSLYNGALDGLSLKGDQFFYGNPLVSDGNHSRREWFGTACCPSNIARLVESVGNYIYVKSEDALWINLFVGSKTSITIKSREVGLLQETGYPWSGDVKVTVSPERKTRFPIHVRLPGWALNQPVPGDTYYFTDTSNEEITITVNGKPVDIVPENGYAVLDREWKRGDVMVLHLPMPVRRIASIDQIKGNMNRIALQRGPLVYCFEHADNDGRVMNIVLPEDVTFRTAYHADLLKGVVTIMADAPVLTVSGDEKSVSTVNREVVAIPYYSWANRGKGQMQVWMPQKITDIKITSF